MIDQIYAPIPSSANIVQICSDYQRLTTLNWNPKFYEAHLFAYTVQQLEAVRQICRHAWFYKQDPQQA